MKFAAQGAPGFATGAAKGGCLQVWRRGVGRAGPQKAGHKLRMRALATTATIALLPMPVTAWAQSCTTASGTVTTSCTGGTSVNGGGPGQNDDGGSPTVAGSGRGGAARSGGAGGGLAGNGGAGRLYPSSSSFYGGSGGGGGVYGGGGSTGHGTVGRVAGTGAGGGGGTPGIQATGDLSVGAGATVTGGGGANGAGGYAYGGGGGGGADGVSLGAGGSTFSNEGQIYGGAGGAGGSGYLSGGGGGGGAGLYIGAGSTTGTNTGNLTGGVGGTAGGYDDSRFSSLKGGIGTGGTGGAGLGIGGAGNSFTNAGAITGGNGGAASAAAGDPASAGGTGGAGGVGAGISGTGSSLTNTGMISGGTGGAGATVGAGGVGLLVSGDSNVVATSGTIAGGMSGDGSAQADAVDITGAGNTFEILHGYSFAGNVVSTGSNNSILIGGTKDSTLDLGTTGAGFQGFAGLTKRGSSTWNVRGKITDTMPWTVTGGTLIVGDDSHPGTSLAGTVTVDAGAVLGGIGTIGGLALASGATVAPGNSIGTLTVSGDLTLAAGSTYAVEVAGDGKSDRIDVTGTATLGGATVTLSALDPRTSYVSGQSYTILTAAGGISGTFDPTVVLNSAFLAGTLAQAGSDVSLTIDRVASFDTVASTRNQVATAKSLDTLQQSGSSLAFYNDLLALDAPTARAAFDSLSGEIHASVKTALFDDSRFPRNAILGRIRSAFSDRCASAARAWTGQDRAGAGGKTVCGSGAGRTFWVQAYGGWDSDHSDGNAARLTTSTGGLFFGADLPLGNWRLGVMGGVGHASYDAADRASYANMDSYTIGAYAGTWLKHVGRGDLRLRLGATGTWYDIGTTRGVTFPGFSSTEKASYGARAYQVFGEAGYKLQLRKATTVEPFANLAYVNLRAGGYDEGGVAGLHGGSDTSGITYTTLGARAERSIGAGGKPASLSGMIGWRHAFGDTTPTATHAFSGANAFTVAGVPIARNVAVVEAGFDLGLSARSTLRVSYSGQFGHGAPRNSMNARLRISF